MSPNSQSRPGASPYAYYTEAVPAPEEKADRFLTAFAAILRHSNYRFLLDMYLHTSSRCGRCAVACPVYTATDDLRDVPCYRTNLLLDVYRRHFTTTGWLRGRFLHDSDLTAAQVDEMAELFYRCTACRRCKLECPMGLDHGLLTRLGRYILSEAGIAPKALVVSVREQLIGKTGNTSGIPFPALLDTLEFLQDELLEIKGTDVTFPVDRDGAEYIFFPAVSDYMMEADTLMGVAAALQAAGISWTIGSGYFDAIDYGLFYSDWALEQIVKKLVAEARRLHADKILIGECGHAARAAKQFVPTFADGRPLPVVSILELTWAAVRDGKIRLDSTAVPERVTYHDPCNIARSGWIVDPPRAILRSFVPDFVEMTPHGIANFCCGGGGGTVSLDETHDFRVQVTGRAKAEQIRATGAAIVVAPCANCKKQLRELVQYHALAVEVVGVHDLILRAIRL